MEKSVYSNGLFEFLETEEEFVVDNQTKTIKRTMVRRSPGIRALIVDKENNKVLLSKEFRYELNEWDYRLPGGKVFDNLEDYKEAINNNDVIKYVEKTVPKEVMEEVGIIVKNQNLIKVSKDGASVIWDLYYYEITDYEISNDGPHLEENELVDGYVWKSFDEVIDLCINSSIHEDRSVGVLLTYILESKKTK
ncbi:MAG: NUDIX hydrolase [Erysipelotrichales bacterium]|nr:NUDIX hydrolase [Erysipelotrichales bacterium]